MAPAKLRVLLTNDDGPPGKESPYIYGLYRHLTKDLGWDVRVVIPSSQKSWIGKAYQIKDVIGGRYYYPRDPDGQGEVSERSRPLKDGEVAQWILLDGTPATCANIALHNIYRGSIDLLISGPNLGRNSSAAFALSSGTIGAALSSSLSGLRSVALSYGTVRTAPRRELYEPAHALSAKVIGHLWDNWGADAGAPRDGEVDLYNVNVPMIEALLGKEGLPVAWTYLWRNSYGRLFKAHTPREAARQAPPSAAGPDSGDLKASGAAPTGDSTEVPPEEVSELLFRWSPDMTGLLNRDPSHLPAGSDARAVEQGWVSVTPLRAAFAMAGKDMEHVSDAADLVWKIKL